MSGVSMRLAPAAIFTGLVTMVSAGCPGDLETMDTQPPLECGRLSAPNEAATLCKPLLAPNVLSRDVEFVSAATTGVPAALKGTVTLPDWGAAPNLGKKAPAVVLIGAEGPLSRDGLIAADTTGPYKAPVAVMQDLAEGLSRRGYVVLRYDKRTCTPDLNPMCTSAPEVAAATTWSDLVGDAVAAAKFLATLPEVNGGDLILMGYSQGAAIALEAGPQIEGLTEVVLLAAIFDPVDTVMTRRLQWQLEARKESGTKEELETLQKQLSVVESGFMAIKEGYMPPEERVMGATGGFWKDWIAATSMTDQSLQTLNRPVLYLRGATDEDASSADQEGFKSAMTGLGAHKVVSLPNHNHAFVEAGQPGEVSAACVTAIAEWLGRPPVAVRRPTVERLD